MTAPRDPEEAGAAAASGTAREAGGGAGAGAATGRDRFMRMGAVHLTVADVDRSVRWYEATLGLRLRGREDGTARLGTATDELLVLRGEPGATPARGHAGLYHFALLVPGRADLARWLVHAARERVPLAGLSDHFVSEAIYLSDPDEHGIEVYWDRPRAVWEGQVAARMTTLPLDTQSLLGELGGDPMAASFDALPDGTVIGHVHLRVAEIPGTVAFYRDLVGFELMAALGGQAAFLGADGYHHHVGANTWESAGAGPAPAGTATLARMTIVLPDENALRAAEERLAGAGHEAGDGGDAQVRARAGDGDDLHVRDPSGNPVVLHAGS